MDTIIQLRNVSFAYETEEGKNLAVQGVDLDVRRGEFLAVVGHNGSG